MAYQIEKVNDPEIGKRLINLSNDVSITEKDKSFVLSLIDTWNRFSALTVRQYEYFNVVEKRYDPSAIQAKNDWIAAWDDWKRFRFNLCCRYYSLGHYFRDLVISGLKDPNFIPTEKQFRAMCENKYAQRLIKNMTENKFDVGDVVELRRGRGGYVVGEGALVGTVVEVSDEITVKSANIGGRKYRVFWMNNGVEAFVSESDLKVYKNK